MVLRVLQVLALALAAPLALLAPLARLQQTPSFRSGVNLIEVDVVVRDKAGNPVRGLSRDEFQIFEDGRPVQVDSFSAIDLPAAPDHATIPPPDTSLSSLGSNDYPEDGRLFLLVLDDFHIRFDASRIVRTKRVARRLIERLAPGDLAAAVSTSSTREMAVEFTSDKARLMAAVNQFFPADEAAAPTFMRGGGEGSGGDMGTGFVANLKARFAADKLIGTARTFAEVRHRRKAVALISEGMPFGLGELMNPTSAGSDVLAALHEFIRIAQQSNIAVYTFDPGDGTEGRMTDRIQNLMTIAEGTGGFATVGGSNVEAGVDRMVAENGSYYLIGYYSPARPADGKHHRITVKVSRPGVEVSAREGYSSPKPKAARSPPAAVTPLDILLAAPLQSRGLPMHVAALPVPTASKDVTAVAITVEVPGSTLAQGRALELVVSAIGLEDAKVRATERLDGRIGTVTDNVPGWVRLVSRMDLKPDRYQIRVVARQTDGSLQGSVFTEVRVPKFDKDLSVSGLAIGTPGGAVRADKIQAMLGIVPVPIREIPLSIPLTAALAIKVDPKESREALNITVTLTGPDGRVGSSDKVSRPAAAFAAGGAAIYNVPVPAVTPGEYRLRIDTALGTNKPIVREIAFKRISP